MGAASLQAASLFSELNPEQKRVWNRLLHMSDGETLIDEQGFFIDPEGSFSAAKELESFVAAAKRNDGRYGRFKLPLSCAYPARIEFLLEVGILKEAPDSGECIPWKKWQKEIAPESLSIIFSTAYPNNPGSMFGHTFLRFHKKGQVNDLLDYGANFSALVDSMDWGPIYAAKGMFGGYPGFFDLSPYYIKVNEYNHTENRDLIEYELNLSTKEVHFILAHLWELYNGAFFDYYFTWENCSFHLAELISVVRELDMPHRWFYLPADLIWTIDNHPELIRNIVQRRSLKKKTLARLEVLDEEQLKRVELVKNGEHFSTLGGNLEEWDALIEWLNFEKYELKGNISNADKELLYLALKKRATLNKKSRDLPKADLKNRPELGHYPQRVGLATGLTNDQEYLELEYRSGFHDLMANDLGFDPFSEFQFLKGSITYLLDEKKLKANDFSLVEIVSLDPWSMISNSLSWKVGGRIETMKESLACRFCHRTRVYGKLGLSFGDRHWILGIFGGGAADYSTHFKNDFEVSLNGEVFIGRSTSWAKFMLGVDSYFLGEKNSRDSYHELFARMNFFLSRNHELRVQASQYFENIKLNRSADSISAQWGFYF